MAPSIKATVFIFLTLFSIFFPADVGAALDDCSDHFKGNLGDTQVIRSRNQLNEEEVDVLVQIAREVFGDQIRGIDGIFQRLGIKSIPHDLAIIPVEEMQMEAAVGRQPTPWALDGFKILSSLSQKGGTTYEFVTGCPYCHSRYRDDTSIFAQGSVIDHVAGHILFSLTSLHSRIRGTDQYTESIRFSEAIIRAEEVASPSEVAVFLQSLESVKLQDFATGSFNPPEELALRDIGKGPSETSSFLQVFVASLPYDTPGWKKTLAHHYERFERMVGFIVANKTANEGFATILQSVLPHLRKTTEGLAVANLLHMVLRQESFSNPYWFGRKIWYDYLQKFLKRPDISALDKEEQFLSFIRHAVFEVIPSLHDHGFVNAMFDKSHLEDKYYLFRGVNNEEFEPNLPRGKDIKDDAAQAIAITNDPDILLDHITKDSFIDKKSYFPRIVFSQWGKNVNEIIGEHEIYYNVPLEPQGLVLALSEAAYRTKKTWNIKTYFAEILGSAGGKNIFEGQSFFEFFLENLEGGRLYLVPHRLKVHPDGTVQVFRLTETEGELQRNELDKSFEKLIAYYRQDSRASYGSDYLKQSPLREVSTLNRVLDYNVKYPLNSFNSVPYAPEAIQRYRDLLGRRALYTLDLYKQGKADPTFTDSGVSFNNAPILPSIGLDNRIKELLTRMLPVTPPDSFSKLFFSLPRYSYQFSPGTGGKVFSVTLEASKNGSGTPKIIQTLDKKATLELSSFLRERELNEEPGSDNSLVLAKLEKISVQNQKFLSSITDDELKVYFRARKKNYADTYLGKGFKNNGEKFWINPPEQSGQGGEGQGEGEGKGGKSGDNPTFVEFPLDAWGEMFYEDFDLPNMRETGGAINSYETIPYGSIKMPEGRLHAGKSMANAYVLGRGSLEDKIEKLKQQIVLEKDKKKKKLLLLEYSRLSNVINDDTAVVTEGMKYFGKEQRVVLNEMPIEVPEYNIVVAFMMDLSASMGDKERKIGKDFHFNIKSAIQHRYPKAEFRYVIFDSEGHEVETAAEFFNSQIGGSTDYGAGFKKIDEIFENYPLKQWNRYVFTVGDSGEFSQNLEGSLSMVDRLVNENEFFAYLHTGPEGKEAFQQSIKAKASMAPDKFGYAATNGQKNGIELVREIFEYAPKGQKKQR